MKKIFIIITIVLALGALIFTKPLIGKMNKGETVFYGNAYASEGGGGF
jgi:hypothetical protein